MADTSGWQKAREEALKLYNEGMTRGEIARVMGKSRNSIIGLLYRMGIRDEPGRHLHASRQRSRRISAHRAKQPPRPIAAPSPKFPFWAKPKAQPFPREPLEPAIRRNEAHDIANPSPCRMSILTKNDKGLVCANEEFTADRCHWPVGDPQHPDFHFCGREAVPGVAYCNAHAARAYISIEPRTTATKQRETVTV